MSLYHFDEEAPAIDDNYGWVSNKIYSFVVFWLCKHIIHSPTLNSQSLIKNSQKGNYQKSIKPMLTKF